MVSCNCRLNAFCIWDNKNYWYKWNVYWPLEKVCQIFVVQRDCTTISLASDREFCCFCAHTCSVFCAIIQNDFKLKQILKATHDKVNSKCCSLWEGSSPVKLCEDNNSFISQISLRFNFYGNVLTTLTVTSNSIRSTISLAMFLNYN